MTGVQTCALPIYCRAHRPNLQRFPPSNLPPRPFALRPLFQNFTWKLSLERLNLDALAYNIKRLYNLIQGEQNNKEDIVDFCESISTTYQLKLDVTIY